MQRMTNQLDRKIAVVLSGCGASDGSEVTEAASVLISISETGASFTCFAPNLPGDSGPFAMANRIARGSVRPLSELNPDHFDGLVFPGGFGAASVLSNFSERGAKGNAIPDVTRTITEFHAQSKPIGAICIAPALVALVLGKYGLEVTVGEDGQTALEISKTGARHTICPVTDYISDRDNKVLTTPAYMYDKANSFEVYSGIRKMIRELVEMA